MSRAVLWSGLAALALGAAAVGGCALFDDDPPDRSCRTDNDCFRAQGERCDQAAKTCILIDAGMAAPEQPDDPSLPRPIPGTDEVTEVTP